MPARYDWLVPGLADFVMPRYFFDVFKTPIIDDDGYLKAKRPQALAYANRVASELKGDFDGWCVVIRDDAGCNIGKVKVGR